MLKVLFSFIISISIFAGPLEDLFKKHYSQNYSSGLCEDNISNFAKEAIQNNLDMSGSYQIKIEKNGVCSYFCYFNPTMSRNYVRRWYYHVIFLKDGVVYDMDYKYNHGIVDSKEYLDTMFNSSDDLSRLQVQELIDLSNNEYLIRENDPDHNRRPHNKRLLLKDFLEENN